MNPEGFEILEAVLPDRACDALARALAASGSRGAGSRHRMRHPAVADLARSSELLAIASRWVGPGAEPFRATVFDKSGSRNWLVVWHQDTALPLECRTSLPDWGPWSMKEGIAYSHAPAWALEQTIALRIHLDPSTSDNGPLRVLPGSHQRGVLPDETIFRMSRELPSVECRSGRGGVMAMCPLLIHSSSKSRTGDPRRVLHLEYASSLELGPGIRLAVA